MHRLNGRDATRRDEKENATRSLISSLSVGVRVSVFWFHSDNCENRLYLLLMPEMEIGWIVSRCILRSVLVVYTNFCKNKSYVITIICIFFLFFSALHAHGKVNPSKLNARIAHSHAFERDFIVLLDSWSASYMLPLPPTPFL